MTAAPFPCIEVQGPARERGMAYGRAAGDRIAAGLALYGAKLAGAAADRARAYIAVLERYDPDLTEEIRAIALGAEQPVEAIVALNARTELTAWDTSGAVVAPTPDECTAALAMPERTTDGRLLHGQNWDWRPGCVDTSIVLVVRRDDGPDIMTFCEAGQLARHGINAAGVALTANGLQTDDEFADGAIPSPLIRRRMLMAGSLAHATAEMFLAARSSSHNLMLSHSGGPGRSEAVNFETTPRSIYWDRPVDGLLSHANHFKNAAALAQVVDIGLLRHPESLYRDARVHAALDADGDTITRATFERAFADDYGHPDAVCRAPAPRSDGSISATVASLIMDAAAGSLWLAPAPFDGARYTEYRLAS